MKEQRQEEPEKRQEEERRSEKRKAEERRSRCGKVEETRNRVFFLCFGPPEGRKVGSLKRRVRSRLGR